MGAIRLLSKFRRWPFRTYEGDREPSSGIDIARYVANGLIVPACRIPEQKLLEVEDSLAEVLSPDPRDTPDRSPHLLGNARFAPAIIRLAQTAEILDNVEQLIGSDIALWGAGIFGKPPIRGKATPWHQDAAFLEYQAIRPLVLCTVWVALDDSTAENGCVRYISGSHQRRIIYSHKVCESQSLTLDRVVEDYNWTASNIQCVALKRGQLSIHDVFLIHGSDANSSQKRRAGIALRYMPTTSCYDYEFANRAGAANRTIYLVRGIDRCGTNHLVARP